MSDVALAGSLKVHVPAQAPQVRFITKINLSCVDKDGRVSTPAAFHREHACCGQPDPQLPHGAQVDPRHFPVLGHWKYNDTMEHILTELRKEMLAHHNRKLPQPPENTFYANS
jgi:ubiquitin-conjugating enzyme E2 variant